MLQQRHPARLAEAARADQEGEALLLWLLIPAAVVIITVMAFNFVGDGLRDADDPYKQ